MAFQAEVKLIDYGVSSHTDGTMVCNINSNTNFKTVFFKRHLKKIIIIHFCIGTEKYFGWNTILDGKKETIQLKLKTHKISGVDHTYFCLIAHIYIGTGSNRL